MERRVEVWTLGAALLASGEFGYAHLRQLGFWPLEVIVPSLWRVVVAYFGASWSSGTFWLAPLALGVAALLASSIVAWRRRRAAADRKGGNHHG